jgi:hypothetical protein
VVDSGTYSPFQLTKNGITVKSAVPGGAHVVATGGNQPAISAYGQSGIGVFDFKVTSKLGDGIKITGAPGKMVSNVRIEGNTVQSAGLDGIKVAQAAKVSVVANQIVKSGAVGLAGTSANANGDGGIDWVQVTDSEMSDNEVSSQGWACAMVKGGSGNNLIADNDLTSCAVNGIDMAAGTSGAADAANDTGLIAYDSTVTGNSISSGGCAVKLGDATKNIKTDTQPNQDCTAGTGNGQTAGGSDGTGGAGDGGGGGWEDYNAETGASLQSSVSSGSDCNSMIAQAASTAAAGIGVIMSITGRATAPLQVAQQLQLVAQSICDGEQADLLGDQLAEQRRMTARIKANAATNSRKIEEGARAAIGVLDPDLYGTDAGDVMRNGYQRGMPEGWTFDTAATHTQALRERTNLATREAAAAAAASNHAIGEALEMSDEALELSQEAEGQTAAIQAQSQLIRSQIAVTAAKHASDTASATASLRMEEERRASEVFADQKLQRFYGPGTLDANAPPPKAVFK